MVQIHLTKSPICPADLTEMRFHLRNLFGGGSDLYPGTEVLEHFTEGKLVRENGSPGFHIWRRAGTDQVLELESQAKLLLDAVSEKATRAFSMRDGDVCGSKCETFEFSLNVSAEATISDIEQLALKSFGLLHEDGHNTCQPLARDIATVTKGAMYADHATHSVVTLSFFFGLQDHPRRFGFDGYCADRGYKSTSATLVPYAGEPGPFAKDILDSQTHWELYNSYWRRRELPASSLEDFAILVRNYCTKGADIGDVFSFVRAGSDTPPAIVSTTPRQPRFLVKIEPENQGWFQHKFKLGAGLGPFAAHRFEELLGYLPKF